MLSVQLLGSLDSSENPGNPRLLLHCRPLAVEQA